MSSRAVWSGGAACAWPAATAGTRSTTRAPARVTAGKRKGRTLRGVDVVVAGGHGKVAQHLLNLLADRGDRARGLIRNPYHAGDLEALGAEPVICDLEREDDVSGFV